MIDTKLLRQKILDLAIRGKLVPQDPNDEPASILLEKIRAEKAELVKQGKIKKDKQDSYIYKNPSDNRHYENVGGKVVDIEDQIPFEVPLGWSWCRISQIVNYAQRGKSPKYSDIRRYPVLAQKCNQLSGITLEKALFIDSETLSKYGDERFLLNGDIVINSTGTGTLGRVGIFNKSILGDYSCIVADSHITVLRCNKQINSAYLFYFLRSPFQQQIILDKAIGSTNQKELYIDSVCSFLVPIPPFKEQQRLLDIIAKQFDLISQIEVEQVELTDLASLKKSKILDLAMRGKLVPQDPNDEPASELLARLSTSHKPHYEKLADFPYEIPPNWVWTRFGEVVKISGGGTPDKANPKFWNGNIPWASVKDIKGDELHKTIDFISKEGLRSKSSISICEIGDIIVATRLVPGKSLISKIRTAINQDLKRIRSNINTEFIHLWFKSMTNYFLTLGKGTTVLGIKIADLENTLFPLPPLNEQTCIVIKINELFKQVDSLKN